MVRDEQRTHVESIFKRARTNENGLLRRIQQQDEQALASLYSKYSRYVFSIGWSILHDFGRAEEVQQDVFLQIWRRPEWFMVKEGCFLRGVTVVSRNRSIDIFRGNKRTESIDNITLASSCNLEKEAEQHLLLEKIWDSVHLLPPEQRLVLKLAYLEDRSHSEIAIITRCPLGTVKTRIRSAVSAIRKELHIALVPSLSAQCAEA